MPVLSLLQPRQRERLTPAQRDDVTREQIAVTFGVLPWAAAVHLVVTLGCEDLIVVHTPDATLVANKHDEESIRAIVKELETRGWESFL